MTVTVDNDKVKIVSHENHDPEVVAYFGDLKLQAKNLEEELDKARIPVGEVLKAKEVVNEPHIEARNLFQKIPYPNIKDSVPIVVSPLE